MLNLLRERFEEKYIPEPTSGCWLWEGTTTDKGYGQLKVNGKTYSAHRLSYEMHKGRPVGGLYVCHHCDTPGCVDQVKAIRASEETGIALSKRYGVATATISLIKNRKIWADV